jgi:hypothetical protein
MSEDANGGKNLSLTVPIGALGAITAIALAAAAYNYLSRNGGENGQTAKVQNSKVQNAKAKGGSMRRKLGLMTLVTLLENDASRRIVISLLKAMARRA